MEQANFNKFGALSGKNRLPMEHGSKGFSSSSNGLVIL
jgi:hypothetical protein